MEMIIELGFDSVTHYQFVHEAGSTGDYVQWANSATGRWEEYRKAYGVYFPHVSIGWDNTQRFPSLTDIVTGSNPASFAAYLHKAKRFCDAHPEQPRLVTINSWNEWTEGSYLLPDMRWGYAYLEAVRSVFGSHR